MNSGIERFSQVREACPALRRILVPDKIWPNFEKWHRQPDDDAHHRSILLLAMERGYLGSVISPVHRYLIHEDQPRREITGQYRQDLCEDWMLSKEPQRRHRRSRMFSGRIAELQFAEWLETHGWKVTGLEAWGADSDVEATSADGKTNVAFEVKLVGVEDGDFRAIVDSLAGSSSARSVSLYDAMNYLLFRVYEAAKQAQGIPSRRIAVVVIEGLTWARFDLQLKDNWIDWSGPEFFDTRNGASHEWTDFLERQKKCCRDDLMDLGRTLTELSELWILSRSDGYDFHPRYTVFNPGSRTGCSCIRC